MRTAQFYKSNNGRVICCGCFEDKVEFDEDLEEFQNGDGDFEYYERTTTKIPVCDSCKQKVETF